ncbi:hypothetical protein PIB30_000078 [Stylosanthes scabra]|uniref:Uncharacterized protein n=1 Tax=Stylosanthes scabra TaxID=79078 RepID=A0ABU6Q3B9_9FABA|nr:hypothetical protein [Stylosanthes scabra]
MDKKIKGIVWEAARATTDLRFQEIMEVLKGMPCVHAIAAICKLRVKPVEYFISPFLTMDAIRATYDIHVNPVNSEEFWYPTEGLKPIAPRKDLLASQERRVVKHQGLLHQP